MEGGHGEAKNYEKVGVSCRGQISKNVELEGHEKGKSREKTCQGF